MSGWKKLASAAAASGEVTNVESVFSTYLYVGNSSSQTITNGIDLAGEGGMVWAKCRDVAYNHLIWDSERGSTNGTAYDILFTNLTNASNSAASYGVTSFNSDGFTLGPSSQQPISNQGGASYADLTYASWTFRKAPKFFDVVTYTGNGNDSRTISHNLSSTPGFAIVKRTNSSGSWICWHRGISDGTFLTLNATSAQTSHGSYPIFAGASSFSDTTVTLGGGSGNLNKTLYNNSGDTYVLYLFAHNDGDGEFGPNGDQDIIKCGSYTGNGSFSAGPSVDLGFKPQWVMIKAATEDQGWDMYDLMRGMSYKAGESDVKDAKLRANESGAENVSDTNIDPTARGFELNTSQNSVNKSGETYIYIAIRRGPMALPEDITDVFGQLAYTGNGSSSKTVRQDGITADMVWTLFRTLGANKYVHSREMNNFTFKLNSDNAAANEANIGLDSQLGFVTPPSHTSWNSSGLTYMTYQWQIRPTFFDSISYKGNGTSGHAITHNLEATPEMIWVKRRDNSGMWAVYHKGLNGGTNPEQYYIALENPNAEGVSSAIWNDTAPSSTSFTLGNNNFVNNSSGYYTAFLFASIDGMCKVGNYTGTGSAQTINCGFSNGARFVYLKNTSRNSTGWILFDSARGITTGNDNFFQTNNTNAETSSGVIDIEPQSSGFEVNGTYDWINASGDNYIFYAIA